MAATYEPIATTTISGTSTYTFSSIPQTYTDIYYVIYTPTLAGVNTNVNFNGDTGANYSFTQLYGEAGFSTPASFRGSSTTYALSGVSDGTAAIHGHIFNYSNTTTYKILIDRGGGGPDGGSGNGRYVNMDVCQWRSTAAITSMTFGPSLSNGTVITLYGIKAA